MILAVLTGLDDAIVSVAAVLAGLGAIIALLARLYRLVQRIETAIGVDEAGHTLGQRLTAVEDALMPPGRDPLATRVDHLEGEVVRLTRGVDRIGVKLDLIERVVIKASPESDGS